jgi:hypothetical protein
MPNVRRHVRVVVDGAKFEVETNALDLAHAERDGEGDTVRGMRTIHNALLRNRAEGVPTKFEAFLSALDSIDDLDGEDEGDGEDLADPTQRKGLELSP